MQIEIANTQDTQDTQAEIKMIENDRHVFRHKNVELLDVVESDGNEFVIPANPGSTYWAILRVAYENHDRPIEKDYMIDTVATILEDRDPERWARFVNKKRVKTFKNQVVTEKDATSWRNRIEMNIKMLCRNGNDYYGTRLRDVGHILRWEWDAFDGKGGYCLRTKIEYPIVVGNKGRKRQKKVLA